MPNNVYTTMIIYGNAGQLDALEAKLDAKPNEDDPSRMAFNLFNAFNPMPEEYRATTSGTYRDGNGNSVNYTYPDLVAKYGANDWYEWANQHWGTKWGTYDTHLVREEGRLILTFSTAWSFPYEFYKTHLTGLTWKARAHEEGSERLIMGDSKAVVQIYPSSAVEAYLEAWAEGRGIGLVKYTEARSYSEDDEEGISYFDMAEDWMSEIVTSEGGDDHAV